MVWKPEQNGHREASKESLGSQNDREEKNRKIMFWNRNISDKSKTREKHGKTQSSLPRTGLHSTRTKYLNTSLYTKMSLNVEYAHIKEFLGAKVTGYLPWGVRNLPSECSKSSLIAP